MVSNGLYDINCEEGIHSNSLSYFSHVSLSFFATLYLQNAKKEHVKVFVARYFFQKNTPFNCLFSQIHVSHISLFNLHVLSLPRKCFTDFVTARQRSWGKVMFSFVSVCSQGGPHVTITIWCIGPHYAGTPGSTPPPGHQTWDPPSATDIWWPSLETCSKLFIWNLRTPNWYWHLVAKARTVGKCAMDSTF